jgi:hypothetical protein
MFCLAQWKNNKADELQQIKTEFNNSNFEIKIEQFTHQKVKHKIVHDRVICYCMLWSKWINKWFFRFESTSDTAHNDIKIKIMY